MEGVASVSASEQHHFNHENILTLDTVISVADLTAFVFVSISLSDYKICSGGYLKE